MDGNSDTVSLFERGGPFSLFETKRLLQISWKDLVWGVREGGLKFDIVDGRYFVEVTSIFNFDDWSRRKRNIALLLESQEGIITDEEMEQYVEQLDSIVSYNPLSPWEPSEIQEYLDFHSTINQFTWLIKSRYSPKSELRKRNIRLDSLFANYLRKNKISIERIKRLITLEIDSPDSKQKASDSLRKVWYNELAYLQPAPLDFMHVDMLGVRRNIEASQDRLLFLSWKVTQAYYVVYHSFRAYCDTLEIPFDPKEHHAPMRAFKGNKLSPALKVLIFFPFNLSYTPGQPDKEPSIPKPMDHEDCLYSRYPRNRMGFRNVLARHIWLQLGKSAMSWPTARRRNELFMLPDYLYKFRTWANYVNIDNLVKLKGRGFKAYMDLDLMTLTFFYSAFAELLFIAKFGESEYLKLAQNFHDMFISTQPGLNKRDAPWPLAVRIKIYKELKILSSQS